MRGAGADRVAAVVVTYNPGDRFKALMTALRPQVGAIWVVDNGSDKPGMERVRTSQTAARDGAEVMLIPNTENRGLAAAQNQGIAAAMDAGFDWVLLMDHDGVPDANMVSELLVAAERDADADSIGILAPRHDDERGLPAAMVYSRGVWGILRRKVIEPGEIEKDAAFAMASGCLIPMACIREVGMMAEDFFIDYIDYDFSFRLRRAGYRIVVVGAARLSHNLGDPAERRFLGRKWHYRQHSARRRFTIYRNRTRVRLGSGSKFPEFKCFEILSIAKDLFQLLFLEPKEHRAAMCRAIRAGLRAGKRKGGGIRS